MSAGLITGWMMASAAMATGAAAPTPACQARSGPQAVALVELYTSEGCDSCPPADRWLSQLKGRADVLAAAFHVDYWDHLGWRDRYAQPAFAQRQRSQQASSGARFVYTPQLLLNGRDWPGWRGAAAAATGGSGHSRGPGDPGGLGGTAAWAVPLAAGAPASVQLGLQRLDGQRVQATLQPLPGAPGRIALWWALLEDGLVSTVAAGENRGATLRHDHVVRQWGELSPAGAAAPVVVPGAVRAGQAPSADVQRWQWLAPRLGEAGRSMRLLLVAVDAASGRTLQAVQLDC